MAPKKINAPKKVADDFEPEMEFMSANNLKKGKYVMLQHSFPCKVVEIHKSKPGKHGSTKMRVVGLDIFTGKKYEHLFAAAGNVTAPVVNKINCKIVAVSSNGAIQLQNVNTGKAVSCDLKLSKEEDDPVECKIKEMLRENKKPLVSLMTALGKMRMVTVREDYGADVEIEPFEEDEEISDSTDEDSD